MGFGLSVWRILRCNPFGKAGYDPVPPKRIPKYQREKEKETHAQNVCDNDENAREESGK